MKNIRSIRRQCNTPFRGRLASSAFDVSCSDTAGIVLEAGVVIVFDAAVKRIETGVLLRRRRREIVLAESLWQLRSVVAKDDDVGFG